jgi:ribokinase
VSGDVIVVGSINADLVVRASRLPARGETVPGARIARHGGGKGANQAVAAARLGARVRFIGAIGDDDAGAELAAQLASEGIDVSCLLRVPDLPSGVAVIIVEESGENAIVVALGANDALREDFVRDALAATARPGDTLLVGGFEIPDAAISATTRHARAAGLRLLVSPAPARSIPSGILDEMFAARAILTPNEGEARALAGEENVEGAALELARRSDAPVLVTLGSRGVLLAVNGALEFFEAPRVDVVDTTGAGDVFTGALAAELAGGAELRAAVRYALAAASLSVSVAGARGGSPTREGVARFMTQAADAVEPTGAVESDLHRTGKTN